jgi:hypothetical protein
MTFKAPASLLPFFIFLSKPKLSRHFYCSHIYRCLQVYDAEIAVCIGSDESEIAQKMRSVVLVQVRPAAFLSIFWISNLANVGPQPATRCNPLPLSGASP